MATKKAATKKPISAKQAGAVAQFLKSQKSGTPANAPKQPTPAQNPVVDADDDEE